MGFSCTTLLGSIPVPTKKMEEFPLELKQSVHSKVCIPNYYFTVYPPKEIRVVKGVDEHIKDGLTDKWMGGYVGGTTL